MRHDRPSRGASAPRRALLPAVCLTALTAAAQEPADPVEVTRKALADWTQTQRIISEVKQDWRLGKETLRSRVDVVKREIESLTKRIEDARTSIADADTKRAELLDENERRKQVADALEQRIAALENQVRALLPRLPEPLAERVKPLSQRLPESAEKATETKLSLSERYQNVIGVLNEISKWNREVTVKSEVRQLADGSSVEVAVIYIGLGQGYYAGGRDENGNPTVAGVGTATAEGWVWKPANELAVDIGRAIAVYKNEQLAKLVRLPVQIL